jgi:hypothetical protein
MQDQPAKAQPSHTLILGSLVVLLVVGGVLWLRSGRPLDVMLGGLGVCVAVAVGRHVTRKWLRAHVSSRLMLWLLDLLWAAAFALALVWLTGVLHR